MVGIATASTVVTDRGLVGKVDRLGDERSTVILLTAMLVGAAWSEREKVVDYYDRAVETLEARPEIRSAGAIWRLPIAEGGASKDDSWPVTTS